MTDRWATSGAWWLDAEAGRDRKYSPPPAYTDVDVDDELDDDTLPPYGSAQRDEQDDAVAQMRDLMAERQEWIKRVGRRPWKRRH
jgi:hypothetical protein